MLGQRGWWRVLNPELWYLTKIKHQIWEPVSCSRLARLALPAVKPLRVIRHGGHECMHSASGWKIECCSVLLTIPSKHLLATPDHYYSTRTCRSASCKVPNMPHSSQKKMILRDVENMAIFESVEQLDEEIRTDASKNVMTTMTISTFSWISYNMDLPPGIWVCIQHSKNNWPASALHVRRLPCLTTITIKKCETLIHNWLSFDCSL